MTDAACEPLGARAAGPHPRGAAPQLSTTCSGEYGAVYGTAPVLKESALERSTLESPMQMRTISLAAAFVVACATTAAAPQEGEPAPDFELPGLGRRDLHPGAVPRQAIRGDRLLPQGVHRRVNDGVQGAA